MALFQNVPALYTVVVGCRDGAPDAYVEAYYLENMSSSTNTAMDAQDLCRIARAYLDHERFAMTGKRFSPIGTMSAVSSLNVD